MSAASYRIPDTENRIPTTDFSDIMGLTEEAT
jgi:hypothetical protein